MKKPSNPFYAADGHMVICPVEDCEHRGNIITKAHLLEEHGLNREETLKLYGEPQQLSVARRVVYE